jgi:hypothetical protein
MHQTSLAHSAAPCLWSFATIPGKAGGVDHSMPSFTKSSAISRKTRPVTPRCGHPRWDDQHGRLPTSPLWQDIASRTSGNWPAGTLGYVLAPVAAAAKAAAPWLYCRSCCGGLEWARIRAGRSALQTIRAMPVKKGQKPDNDHTLRYLLLTSPKRDAREAFRNLGHLLLLT